MKNLTVVNLEERTARLTILIDPRKKTVFERLCAQEDLTSSQVVRRMIRSYIESRLGRPLEPFDVWYSGFSPRESRSEEELDRVVRERFPSLEAFQSDLPRVLRALGFAEVRAAWLAERIVVDPARGPGHAMGAARRGDQSHLRTRAHNGMGYQTFNVAMHELGHCVEQVFSLDAIDHWSLSGVPNTAFTEAFAFTFQERDLEILGFGEKGEDARAREVLQSLWSTYEICGVSLIDMEVWNWAKTKDDYSVATYWYGDADATSNAATDEKLLTVPGRAAAKQ